MIQNLFSCNFSVESDSIVGSHFEEGISIIEYLKMCFCKITKDERDYARLMPQTTGISIENA